MLSRAMRHHTHAFWGRISGHQDGVGTSSAPPGPAARPGRSTERGAPGAPAPPRSTSQRAVTVSPALQTKGRRPRQPKWLMANVVHAF